MKGASHGSISAADDVSLPLGGWTVSLEAAQGVFFFCFTTLDCHATARGHPTPELPRLQPICWRGDADVLRNVRVLVGPDANLRLGAKWKPLPASPRV